MIKNGHGRLSFERYDIEGYSEKFKPLTDEEQIFGSMFSGFGEIIEKRPYKRSDGTEGHNLVVRAPSGQVKLAVFDAIEFAKLPPSGFFTFEGKLLFEVVNGGYSKTQGVIDKTLINFQYMKCTPFAFGAAKARESA